MLLKHKFVRDLRTFTGRDENKIILLLVFLRDLLVIQALILSQNLAIFIDTRMEI
jgi:hypothetical protein